MTVTLTNVNSEFLPLLKNIATLSKAEIQVSKTKKNTLKDALKELDEIHKNPQNHRSFSSAKELIDECLNG